MIHPEKIWRRRRFEKTLDGNLLTLRGAGTALDFGLALVAILADDSRAEEIRQAILA